MTTESATPGAGENAITMLTNDHREVERLYDEFQRADADDTQRRQELANQIIHELSVHAVVEEQYLYLLTADVVSDEKMRRAKAVAPTRPHQSARATTRVCRQARRGRQAPGVSRAANSRCHACSAPSSREQRRRR